MINLKPASINSIKGIFFDYGGVLENVEYKEESFNKGLLIIKDIIFQISGNKIETPELEGFIKEGLNKYSTWYKENNYVELPNSKIWTEFFLKKLCENNKELKNAVAQNAEKLSSVFEFYLYYRRPNRGVKEILKSIFNMGYTLALVSNTISTTLIPERLEKLDVKRYFSSIILSVSAGVRKPRPEIFEIALKETGLSADQCIYIGDTLSRDVEGSKNAGFAKSILLISSLTKHKDRDYSGNAKPDHTVNNLSDVIKFI